jgi:hypothetical protein
MGATGQGWGLELNGTRHRSRSVGQWAGEQSGTNSHEAQLLRFETARADSNQLVPQFIGAGLPMRGTMTMRQHCAI